MSGGNEAKDTVRGGSSYVLDVEGIRVEVTRKRVKNVNMRLADDGTVRMSVPWHMSRAEAERVAQAHVRWMRASIGRQREREVAHERSWETGSQTLVWGQTVQVRVEPSEAGDTVPSCSLEEGELVLRGCTNLDAEARGLVVERWLSDELRRRVAELLADCEGRVGKKATSITLRRMKTRWGSCTARTGRIRLNTALAECPVDCTRTVLVHELCHLREQNHGSRFYALMDLCCPDWRVWQRWLDQHPPRT